MTRRLPTPARGRRQSPTRPANSKQAGASEAAQKRLEAQLHERLAAAEQSIAATRTAAMGNVRAIAAVAATAIVERLIGKAPSVQDVAAVLGDSSGDLGKS